MTRETELDAEVRSHAFLWIEQQRSVYGEELPRTVLAEGFLHRGTRVPLMSPQGIFQPKVCAYPLTITTAPNGPYEDTVSKGDMLHYMYRASGPDHRDNVGLKRAMRDSVPLIHLFGLRPGWYVPTWPVYIVGANDSTQTFDVVADTIDALESRDSTVAEPVELELRRRYATRLVQQRLHQRSFRDLVLSAYSDRCSVCRLGHMPLLDAAHIIPDSHALGRPRVDNGIALCKLHHAAYDANIVGISPDYILEVRLDILEEKDGPMLEHGLKEMHGSKIRLPKDRGKWPRKENLAQRYQGFLNA